MPEKYINVFNINLTLAPEVDQSNATTPQISPYPPSYGNGFAPPTAGNGFAPPGGFAPPSYEIACAPPSNENGFAPPSHGNGSARPSNRNGPVIPSYENGSVPITEIYDGGQRFVRRGSKTGRPGKTMQVGNARYEDVAMNCIESFCQDCRKRVSTGLSYR